jgi:hypothetical protein
VYKTEQYGPANESTVEIDAAFLSAHIASSLKLGGNNVWIRNTRDHLDYLLDCLDRKESVRTTLRFQLSLSRLGLFENIGRQAIRNDEFYGQ